MKIGLLSDVHGNLIALEKCLNYLNKISVDVIYFLGDAVGYYPQGIEVLNRLVNDKVHCLMGNHEAMLLGLLNCSIENEKIYQLEKIREVISSDLIDFIKNLSPDFEFNLNGKNIKLMHGGPANFLTEYIYPNNQLEEFNGMPYNYFFMGHTHYPFIKVFKNQTIVNIGSCGMPRDYGTLSSFAVFDTLNSEINILRIDMDTYKIKKLYCNSTHKSVFDLYERKPNHFTGILIKE
jgi:putative phosphoesterase